MTLARQEGTFLGKGQLKLYYRRWAPELAPAALLVIAPGKGEHSDRYDHVAQHFAALGLAVYTLDHRGFGRSAGVRCHVDRFDDYVADLRTFIALVRDYEPRLGKPVLLGHSLGGLMALRYCLLSPETVRALVLSSPVMAMHARPSRLKQRAAQWLAAAAPRTRLGPRRWVGIDTVRRDPVLQERVHADPYADFSLTARWIVELVKAQAVVLGAVSGLRVPSLWLQAGVDTVVSSDATRQAYTLVRHPDKTFQLFDDAYHELFNEPEPERTRVMEVVADWLRERGILSSGG